MCPHRRRRRRAAAAAAGGAAAAHTHTHTRSFKDLLTHHWQVYAPDTSKRPIKHKAKKPRAKRKRKQLREKTL